MVSVRRASHLDFANLMRIEELSFGSGERASQQFMSNALASPETAVLLAEQNGRAIGSLIVFLQRGESDAVELEPGEMAVFQIASIAVEPPERGRGVARALLNEGLAFAKARSTSSCFRIVAEANPDNTHSLALLKSSGFEERSRCPGYYPNGDAIRFAKALLTEPQA